MKSIGGITMDYIAILGHEPTANVKRIIEALNAYVEARHQQHPEIPEELYWDDILEILNRRISEG